MGIGAWGGRILRCWERGAVDAGKVARVDDGNGVGKLVAKVERKLLEGGRGSCWVGRVFAFWGGGYVGLALGRGGGKDIGVGMYGRVDSSGVKHET